MAFLNGFYDMYSQFLRMVFDFLNTACNTNYCVFIIYFITTLNFIIALYKLIIGVVTIIGSPVSIDGGKPSKVGVRDYWYKVHKKQNKENDS